MGYLINRYFEANKNTFNPDELKKIVIKKMKFRTGKQNRLRGVCDLVK